MKNFLKFINEPQINEELDERTKLQFAKIRNNIEKVLKSMDLGGLKQTIYPSKVNFELGRSYDFWIELDRFRGVNNLYFSSIASHGEFTTGDETYKFYKALGVLLSQEDKLEQIRQLFLESRQLANKID